MSTIEAATTKAKEFAHSMVPKCAELIPMLHMVCKDKEYVISFDSVPKHSWRAVLEDLLCTHQAIGYVFTSEAWVGITSRDAPLLHRVRDLPADDRHDAVIVLAVTNGQASRLYSAKVTPDRGLQDFDAGVDVTEGRIAVLSW